MKVELWQLIRDWLPEAGWEILSVRPPNVDMNGDMLPAFIGYSDVQNHAGGHDLICAIYDDKVTFFDHGALDYTLNASRPDFFSELDKVLTTLFAKSEWWQKKVGWSVTGHHREKIWPK